MAMLAPAPYVRTSQELVIGRFVETVNRYADAAALRWRVDGTWASLSWGDYAARAAAVAGGLRALGVRRGDRVGLYLRNRPEFHVTDLGLLLLGAVPVSFYNTSPPERLEYLAGHSGAVAVVTDDAAGFERVSALSPRLPSLRRIVVVEDAPDGAVPFTDLLSAAPVDLARAARAARGDEPVTIIYTSGTTGLPKGAVITQDNAIAAVDGLLGALGHPVAGYEMVSALPMAHVAERVASHYLHLSEGTQVTTCADVGLLPRYLSEVRPRAFFAVPRLWEKASALIHALAALDPAGQASFDEALAVGAEVSAARSLAQGGDLARRWEEADRVLAPVRALVGLDRCEVAVTTAAPISPDVLQFFRSLGIPISELYGLSEATGPVTWDPVDPVVGDVGRPLPGTEVRIGPGAEILVRGATVFAGYLDDPAATAQVLDAEGWLHTGDLGVLERGRLRVVGRDKDLLVTAGGENVAPAAIESLLRGHPLVSDAFVVGDARPYLVAMLTLDPEAVGAFAAASAAVSETSRAPSSSVQRPALESELARWVEEVNRSLSRVEQVKRFAILEHDWAADSDELTPTMKIKRQAVLTKFADDIDRLYR